MMPDVICFRSPSRLLALGLLAFWASVMRGAAPVAAAPRVDVTVEGRVTDLTSGLPLAGATVSGSGQRVESDLEGRFVLDLPPGRHRLHVDAIGYGSATVIDQKVVAPRHDVTNDKIRVALPPFAPDALGLRAMVDRLRAEPELSADLRGLLGPPGQGSAAEKDLPVSIFDAGDPEDVPEQVRVLMPDGSITAMAMDSYLKGVVPAEMGYLYRRGFAALMAQAIASRTYAAVRCLPASAGDPDVCERGLDANVDTTTRTQVWRNVHYDISDAAVETTHGQVARNDGKLLNALFFARAADRTLSSEESRCCGGRSWSYLRSVSSPEAFAEPWGHGAGLSQEGAATLADWGASAEEIVEHYYAGARVDIPQQPHLYDAAVTPREGSPATSFNFAVSYVSWDNLAPVERQVWIDDTPYVMDGPSGPEHDYRSGADYRFEGRLPAGRHTVRFAFSGGRQAVEVAGGEVLVQEAEAFIGAVAAATDLTASPTLPATTPQAGPAASVEVRAGRILLTSDDLDARPDASAAEQPLSALSLDLAAPAAPDLAAVTLDGPVVEAEFPFMAVGARLDRPAGTGDDVTLQVRSSRDGVIWSSWQSLTAGDGDAREDLPGASSWTRLLITRGRYLQSRALVIGPRDQVTASAAGAVESLELHYFNSDSGPGAPLSSSSARPAALTSMANRDEGDTLSATAVSVIARAGWGADESKRRDAAGNEIWPPVYTAPRAQLVHHTVTTNDPADPAAVVRAIYQYHAVSQGWGDIGYNFLVDHRGNLYEGRYGGERQGKITQGGHALQFNPNTIGVALLGTYTTASTRPPAAMEGALVSLLAEKGQRYGIQPDLPVTLAGTRFAHSVMGHRDSLPGHTQCPGDGVYGRLEGVRTAVRVRMAELAGQPGGPPPPTPRPPTAPPPTLAASGCGDALSGGDFEQEDARWVRNRAYYTSWEVYQGGRALFIGLRNADADPGSSYASAQQAIRLPARLGSAQLRFAAQTQGDAADQRIVRVVDAGGRTLALGTLAIPPTSEWKAYTFDLTAAVAAAAGQEIRLYFGVVNNGDGHRSYMRVDAVELRLCAPAGAGTLPSPGPTEPTAAPTAGSTAEPTAGAHSEPTATAELPASEGGPPTTPLCGPLLQEGFENAGPEWQARGGHAAQWVREPVFAGAGALRLGLVDPAADSFDFSGRSRSVAIPKGALTATLRLQLAWAARSLEDTFLVELRDVRHGVREVLLSAGGEDAPPLNTWTAYTLPLGPRWLNLPEVEIYLALFNRGQREVPGGVSAVLLDALRLDACWRPGQVWLPVLRGY